MINKAQRTLVLKGGDTDRSWYIIDASTAPLGRVATQVATLLIGKHKPTYTPHIDNGDYVVVINASKLVVTGRKLDQKFKHHYTGYVGNLKSQTLGKQLQTNPTKVVKDAVYGMISKNKLHTARIERLKIYATEEHPHGGQQPKSMEIK